MKLLVNWCLKYPLICVGVVLALIAFLWSLFKKSSEAEFVPAVAGKSEPDGLSNAGLTSVADAIHKALDGLGNGGGFVLSQLVPLSDNDIKRLYNVYGKRPISQFYLGSVPIFGRIGFGNGNLDLVSAIKFEFDEEKQDDFRKIFSRVGLWK